MDGFKPREVSSTPFWDLFWFNFRAKLGPKAAPKQNLEGTGSPAGDFCKICTGLSEKHIFAFTGGSKGTQNGHMAGPRMSRKTSGRGSEGDFEPIWVSLGGCEGGQMGFWWFWIPGEFRVPPSGPLFGPIFGPGSGPKQPQNRTWRALGRRKAIFAKFARRLSGKHIFAFTGGSKETQNGHLASSRTITNALQTVVRTTQSFG